MAQDEFEGRKPGDTVEAKDKGEKNEQQKKTAT
jgi:hypothetical protein